MLQYNSSVSGSLSVTGSLIVTNDISGTINGIHIQSFSSSVAEKLSDIQTTTGPQTAKLTSIEAFTSSTSARLNSIETISASNIARIDSLETTSASVDTLNTNQNARLSALEVTSASVDTLNTNQNTRLTSLEIKTGSLASTGSNTFIGNQTITGSLFISSNLVVQGTSSLQNITASAVSIGTNIVNLNTANPAIRYAGLSIGDSGSIGGSGSFLYDSVQDEMIFIHRGANTTVTSSVVLMGPQTYDNIGTETYPTSNIIQKGTGNEHLVDSCIFDDGTNVCINANLRGIGNACFTSICSSNVIGSTAIFGSTSGTCINITTNGNNGTSISPLQTSLNFRGLNNNLNGQIRVDDISGTVQVGAMQFYTWNSGQVSALTLCHNSSAVFYGAVSAPSILASGCIGINETSPSSLLHFSKQTTWGTSDNRIININNTGTGGDINQPHNMGSITWYSGNSTPTAEIAAYRNTPASGNNIELRFYTATAGTPLERMRITSTGLVGLNTTNFGERLNIGCGGAIAWQNTCNCQKWHIQYNSADGLNFVESAVADFRLFLKAGGGVGIGTSNPTAPLTIRCDSSSSAAFMEIATCFQNAYRYVSINGGTGIAFCIPGGTSQSPFIEVQGGDQSATGGSFRIRTGAMGSVTDKLNIAQNGVACFASNVCAANFSSPGFLRVHNTMKTFAISKNFGERESDANYFRISSSVGNGYQVMIYSVAQNPSVGWVQSQLYQAATAPYWGGWVGTSGAITTTGSGAGYINSVVNGNDGTLTFRVTTGNNGTTTTGTIVSYIQVTAFSIDAITLTAL